MLYDNHGRLINYMRLAVTDRCNLRCQYCMPECGIDFLPRKDLLTFEEMLRLAHITAGLGIHKIRITGGEPFVRKGLMDFLNDLSKIRGVDQIHLTTNGTLLTDKIDELRKLGITSINLSIDSLDRQRFHEITRRDELPVVMKTLHTLIDQKFDVKLNTVVMANKNIDDILPILELSRTKKISVRFLEEMPFNGKGKIENDPHWNHADIYNFIISNYSEVTKIISERSSTSVNYQIKEFHGTFGIIASYSRTFCGSCNRIRLTPQGMLRTCLYDSGVFNIRDLMRAEASDDEIKEAIVSALSHRAVDGFAAEAKRSDHPISESMATIGG